MTSTKRNPLDAPLWAAAVLAAIVAGTVVGRVAPHTARLLWRLHVGTTNVTVAACLVVAVYAAIVSVPTKRSRRRVSAWPVVLDAVIGPILTFGLALVFLHNHPQFMSGIILFGCARCVAAGLGGWKSLIGVVLCGVYVWLFLSVLSPRPVVDTAGVQVGIAQVVRSVGVYLGLPIAAALVTRSALSNQIDDGLAPAVRLLGKGALLCGVAALCAMEPLAITGRSWELPLVALPVVLLTLGTGRRVAPAGGLGLAVAFGLLGVAHEAPFAVAIAMAIEGLTVGALGLPGRRGR